MNHSDDVDIDDLMASQIAYYRAHAPRYDDWWYRERDHDLGESFRSRWEDEISTLRGELGAFAPLGHVLEFAGGTGNWTAELVQLAQSVTVVDTSPEVVEIARGKISAPNVSWYLEDIFTYRPGRRFDTVFFSFWLSHVPSGRFERFWSLVADCLEPEGRVFFIDNAHPSLAGDAPELARLHDASTTTELAGLNAVTELTTGISTRLAADGSTYDLVKIWRTSEELESQLSLLGWDLRVRTTRSQFVYGQGSPAR